MGIKSPLPRSEALLRAVQEALGPSRRPLLIAIDGADGVGKSSLASWLAWQLELPAVHLDLYLTRDSEQLRWRKEELAHVIRERIDLGKPIIVEGVLVLDALNEIARCADFLIFIRGQGGHGLTRQISDYYSRLRPEANAHFTLQGFDV